MGDIKNVYTCFPGGKHKVLTLSYDDGQNEDRRLVELFNKYGLKGTFHLNSGLHGPERVPQSEYSQLYKGHEISCHTVLHPTISRCPIEQVALQVLCDRKNLEKEAGYPVRGMSYPNGSYSPEIVRLLPSLGIEYSRVVGDTHAFGIPEDFLTWKATCHHNHNLLQNADNFLALHKQQYLYMLYVWGHSYEFRLDNNWELMEQFCQRVSGNEDIWYATNIEIVDYMAAAKRLKISINADCVYNPSACSVFISIDGTHYEIKGGETLLIK